VPHPYLADARAKTGTNKHPSINALQVSAGRGGTVFDEDPKRWRLIAEGVTTSGRALEIATAVFPQQFVLLAGVLVSVSTKAAGRWEGGGGAGLGCACSCINVLLKGSC